MAEENLSQFVLKQNTMLKEIPYKGEVVKVWYWRVTRGMRQRAIDKATWAYYNDHKHLPEEERRGFYTDVLERELANACIKRTNLPAIPGAGWDNIEAELGDLIVKELDLLSQIGGQTAVAAGKNLQAGAAAAAPAPTSETPTTPSPSSSSTVAA